MARDWRSWGSRQLRTYLPELLACIPLYNAPYSPCRGTYQAAMERRMDWKQLLAYMTGSGDQDLLLRYEYLSSSLPALPGPCPV